MTHPHRPCLDALTDAMALPSVVAVPDHEDEWTLAALAGRDYIIVPNAITGRPVFIRHMPESAQGPPRRQQGEVRRYERRRAGCRYLRTAKQCG